MGYWQTVLADDGLFDLRIDVSVEGNPAYDLHSNVMAVLIGNTATDIHYGPVWIRFDSGRG